MTPKQIALRNTGLVVISGLTAGILINLAFTFLTVPQIGLACGLVVLGLGVKLVYDIELSKAETLEKFNNN
jgi:hypothetical protein